MFGCSARTARLLRCGASTMVLGAALLQANPAFADSQPTSDNAATPLSQRTSTANPTPPSAPEKNAIIITGTRRALRTSQQIKKNADTVVDSITATDIGAFPDKSVAEALQRVPGITVNRFAATADTAHFSAEPSGVIIRGLPQVRSEFNGRDTFSANSGRGISWTDITPELLAGVDVYKNETADMIEGGIAGTVDLRTRVPFDAAGQLIQVGVRANYGDLDKKWTPDINGFYSNRWDTSAGEFGIMANLAYSEVKTRSQGIQYGRAAIIENGFGPNGPAEAFMPASINFLNNEYDRKRYGIAAAGQWKSNSGKLLVTGQYLRSLYKNTWQEDDFGSFGLGPNLYGFDVRTRVSPTENSGLIPAPAPNTPAFTFDSNGNFQSGTPNTVGGWWGNPPGFDPNAPPAPGVNLGFGVNDQGQAMFDTCYTWATPSVGCQFGPTGAPSSVWGANGQARYGIDVGTDSRVNSERDMTQDVALNVKWDPTNDLHFNFDGQYVNSTVDNYDISIEAHSFANVTLDAPPGELPRITLAPPTNINQSSGGLANPDNWYWRSVMDHLEKSKGHEYALRADGEYDFHTDWLDSLKFGARWADRKQLVQWSTYNWQNIANTWTDCGNAHPYWNIDSKPGGTCNSTGETFHGYPTGAYTMQKFGAPFFGGDLGTFPYVPFGFLGSHGADLFSRELTGVGQFIPICDRNGQIQDVTPTELPNSCFTPDEVANVEERTQAGYVELKFGGPNALIGNMPFRGNIGLRYVRTEDPSTGAFAYAHVVGINASQCPATPLVPGGLTGTGTANPNNPQIPYPNFCYLTPQDLAFSNGGYTALNANAKHTNLLPSLNLRLDLSREWLIRFAASRAMSRPDIGLLKNFERVSQNLPATNAPTDSRWIKDANGNIIGVNPIYSASAFNPYLKPITADQFDLSLEHYFGNAGQFSVALFHKKFYNYIQSVTMTQDVTNNGVTRPVLLTEPVNAPGAKIDGFEVAYDTFFDFLPKPFDGFGIQANYTYVKNSGITNTNLGPPNSPTNTNAGNKNTSLDPGALEGISKHTFNLVGLYEKGRISARVAYNWRSKYLVTAVDCCVYLPVWQKASGYLDASIRYRLTDSIELSLEGSNLLNTKTVLLQQVTDKNSPEGKIILTPNGWFQNDRRFIVGVRWKMASAAAPVAPPPVALPPPPPPAATQTCADGSVILATAACPAPPPPPPAAAPERGF